MYSYLVRCLLNLIDLVLLRTGFSQTELAKKLNVSKAQISKWKSGESVPEERNDELYEIAGLDDQYNFSWFYVADDAETIESWINLIQGINRYSEYPSTEFATDPDFLAYKPLFQLMNLGCQIPKEPLSPTEYHSLEAEDKLTPFYKLLGLYIYELGLMETWLDNHLVWPYSINDAIEIPPQIDDEIALVEEARYLLALRCMDEALLTNAGISVSVLKDLIGREEREVSFRISKICDYITSNRLEIKHDLYAYATLNGVELFDDTGEYAPTNLGDIWNHASYFESHLREQCDEIQNMLRDMNLKLDLLLQHSKIEIPELFELLNFRKFPPKKSQATEIYKYKSINKNNNG